MEDIFGKLEERRKWLESLPDGVPCDHRGCLSHISHPCESCGRIGGKRLTKRVPDADWTCKKCGFENHGSWPECGECQSLRS